jgi:hypothetical protein
MRDPTIAVARNMSPELDQGGLALDDDQSKRMQRPPQRG